MTNLPELAKDSPLAAVRGAKTPTERQKAAYLAGDYVTNAYFKEPVPAFFLDLPTPGDDDEVSDRIALANLVAEDPDKAALEAGTTAAKDLAGETIVVWDIRAMAGGMESGWKAYLIFDFTRGDSDLHEVGNTGAKQVVVRLARAFADGQLPIKGRVTEIARSGASGNKPLAFIAETDF